MGIGNRLHELARLLRAGHGRRVARAVASRPCARAGFTPDVERQERWLLGRRST